ncbi:MAG: extracellular solute-binding protein [Clostridiales bacterium]|nr:extracellular solute-binding protein [Clostridiales bacterium]
MKKFVSLLLSLALLLGMMSFAAAEAKEEMTLNVMLPDFYADSEWKTLEDGNPVLQAIYEATGVKLNITWVANSAYTEMTSLTLADTKNMPEVMVIQGPRDSITINSARAGAFWDLTDYIPQYENLAAGSETVYENTAVDGRTYGIYRSRAYARAGIYYRSDIAKEVGIEAEPTNVKEFKDLCFALAAKSDDTYAINMCKYVAGTIGITTVMFGAPYQYGIDADGKIYPAFENAKFQEGLDFLRELYEKGGIDPDFMTIESGNWDDAERNENPKAFMRLDCLDNGYRYQEWLETNLGYSAEEPVVALFNAIPNDDGLIQIWPQNTGASGEIVITKAVSEEKLPAVIKFLDWCNSAEGQTLLNWGAEGETYWIWSDGFRYSWPEGTADADKAKYEENTKVIQHSLNQLGMNVNGDLTPAAKGTILRDEYNKELLKNSNYVIANPCLTYDSETNTLMGATLNQDVEDAQVQYIAGKLDLAGLQAAYQTWHDMGGDMILSEYQAIYDAAK